MDAETGPAFGIGKDIGSTFVNEESSAVSPPREYETSSLDEATENFPGEGEAGVSFGGETHGGEVIQVPRTNSSAGVGTKEKLDFHQQEQIPEQKSLPSSPVAAEQIRQPDNLLGAPLIELLDSDEEGDASEDPDQLIYQTEGTTNLKRKISTESGLPAKRPLSGSEASYLARKQSMPDWMRQRTVNPTNEQTFSQATGVHQQRNGATMQLPQYSLTEPTYIPTDSRFVPTWKALQSFEEPKSVGPSEKHTSFKHYELSLLNVSEFTVDGAISQFSYDKTSISGLRVHIKSISRDHGKAVFERDVETREGKWRIPLGAYRGLYTFLSSQPNTTVTGIDEMQLKIASLGKALLERDYPSERKLMDLGVPANIANTLAPFQRGGVEFVYEKGGRALIADEMGLGKTIQGIASMSLYHQEWPILVLCPSGARYQWQVEFLNWLGEQKQDVLKLPMGPPDKENVNDGDINSSPPSPVREKMVCMDPLTPHQVHVLTSGKENALKDKDTKVVICSYGLAPSMIKSKRIYPGQFRCAIVDESHMLKNKKSQRTQRLMPVLQATSRCVLLSGTPAFARPMELWPQLVILGTENNGWGIQEEEFIQKYVKGGSKQRRAELYTMLTGTIMIRRMKADILKSLPAKIREQAIVGVINASQREEFQQCIELLRGGKGALGKIAKGIKKSEEAHGSPTEIESPAADHQSAPHLSEEQATFEMQQMYQQGTTRIQLELASQPMELDSDILMNLANELDQQLQQQCRSFYTERLSLLNANAAAETKAEMPSRKSVLMHLFKRTGQVKIPLIVKMLKKWIDDPAKGKLCLFAHHIFVLNEIEKLAGLSNAEGSDAHFIRIDGSTGPKLRQQQINIFQKDPLVRIALLGITAAGVAVTLTASSTVWFAELFWTPALMIQAEDRCHRIGQQARVRCLYIVAKGTLDEILWKHVEKKFQNLGEFVEGKEKLKMVVHKTYKGAEEWGRSLERTNEEEDDDADFDDSDEPKFIIDAEGVEEGIVDEIHQLEEEEQAMLRVTEADDDELECDASGTVNGKSRSKTPIVGSSEADAICLSDDDDETAKYSASHRDVTQRQAPRTPSVKELLLAKSFPALRLYKMHFTGETYGLDIVSYNGRIVVRGQSRHRIEQFGVLTKPASGDILVACNNKYIPYGWELSSVLDFLESALKTSRSPVELLFAEDPEFSNFFASNPHKDHYCPPQVFQNSKIDFNTLLRDAEDFDLEFYTPSQELNLQHFGGFPIIANVSKSLCDVGLRDGDIVIATNGQFLPPGTTLEGASSRIAEIMKFLPATITFRRSETFFNCFTANNEQLVGSQQAPIMSQPRRQQDCVDAGPEMIDLIDQ